MVDGPLDYPWRISGSGRVASTDEDDHIRDLISQVLFTSPGERVNQPEFGCGLQRFVFAPQSDLVATATQFIVQGSLQRWLADVILVEDVRVEGRDAELVIEVVYVRRDTGARRREAFVPPGAGGPP